MNAQERLAIERLSSTPNIVINDLLAVGYDQAAADIQTAVRVVSKLEQEINRIGGAAKALVARLESIHNDPHYMAVWESYAIHGGNYSNGPKYDKELESLKTAIDAAMKGA